jgi:hypothetical protein
MIIFAIGSLIGAIATGGWSIVIQMLLSTFAVAVGCVLGQIAAAIVIKGLWGLWNLQNCRHHQ